ncbi:MAG: hypothetical protein WA708_04555 [Acidobacteriaceae bacterium]
MKVNPWIERALHCYPSWWRARYGDELRAVATDLTADGRSPFTVTLNLLEGAVRVRSRAQGMPKTYRLWSARTRLSVAGSTLTWLLMAPLVFMSMGHQNVQSSAGQIVPPQTTITGTTHFWLVGKSGLLPAPPQTPAGPIVTYSTVAMLGLFLITLITLTGGWRVLTGSIRHSSAPDRWRVWALAWVPGFAFLTAVALIVVQNVVRPSAWRSSESQPMVALNGHPAAAHTLGVLAGIVAIVGWLLSIGCVALAAKRAEMAPADLRYGRSISNVVTVLFALLLAAYVSWGIGLILQARQAAHGTFTIITYSHQNFWLPMSVVLVLAVVLSGLCARAANRSWTVISTIL